METSKEFEMPYRTAAVYPAAFPQVRSRKARYEQFKRTLDVMAASAGLLLLSPLFMLIAVWMKIDDPRGNVFFRQVRIGKDGRTFQMIKFRSMVTGAEHILDDLLERNEVAGKMFKMKEDPRITRIGRFLRRTSVDELPQLWNVLRGEMSLVGPRPALPREVELYSPWERQRLTVIPGCTGLWQVSGRNGLDFHEMVELDLYYIRNRNVRLDVLLILKTVKEMVYPNNAY